MNKKFQQYKIPLYNCYWCRCGWCIYRYECVTRICIKCMTRDKFKFENFCERFEEDSLLNRRLLKEVQKCDKCKYKKMYHKIKNLTDKITEEKYTPD